ADAGHARNWLYRTALHRALDLLRSGRRRETRENVFKASESVPNPEDLVQRRELRRDVARALRRIRTRYAAVLALRYTGFSYKEIAEVIDVNVNQVGTLLLRAEAAFKKEYDRVSSLE
ncbi:MAG: sigma-70 family RNA polymerase sigma factor, partial [Candidatus Eremiobacteraeota bacterium]|nr:sigma-70 family RNA polymerase sigma factor [Candidatus Eremiobacteraeota bacterium]